MGFKVRVAHVLVLLIVLEIIYPIMCDETPVIVSREEWGARLPKERVPNDPALVVVIHHTFIPKACFSREGCVKAMRFIQDYHMDYRNWSDISYNFAIGADAVYEGRGWQVVGAHAKGHNNNSVGIVFIGDYRENVPRNDMLAMCDDLINFGVANRHIQPNYQLIGHREVGNTECPGNALYTLIQTWSHWVPKTTSALQ